jgi:lipopolysaccharide O-acetyltransferase
MNETHDIQMHAPLCGTPRIVTIEHERPAAIQRLARRVRGIIRSWRWRRRLAAFGRGAGIDAPALVTGGRGIAIGDDVRIWSGSRLEAFNLRDGCVRLSIGDGTVIQPGAHIGAVESVRIGRGVLMASGVYITDHDHDFTNPREPVIANRRAVAAPVEIGDHAWLGERAMVLKGVRIGEGAVIGAGSVVTRSIPPFAVAIGAPARVVRTQDRAAGPWRVAA